MKTKWKMANRLDKMNCYRKLLLCGWVPVLIGAMGLAGCQKAGGDAVEGPASPAVLARVTVTNPSATERGDEPVFVDLASLGLAPGDKLSSLGFFSDGAPVPHQFVDVDGDGASDRVLLLPDLAPAASLAIVMERRQAPEPKPSASKRTHAEISVKAGGAWHGSKYVGGVFQSVNSITVPDQYTDHSEYIRYEGPGIESDLVGYRVYLDWRNGFDIFAKQQYGLQLARIGVDGYSSYHELADWGMDVLKVGSAVGVGGFGYWDGQQVLRLSDVQDWTASIIEDGDLYSAFAIDYSGWKVAGRILDVRANLSMTAGSRSVRVDLQTSEPLKNIPVGIVRHEGTELLVGDLDVTGAAWSYMASLGPQSLDGRRLAMYVLFKKRDLASLTEDAHNYVALLEPQGKGLSYYFGALWEGEPGADLEKSAVEAMLRQQVARLTYQPRLRIDNAMTDAARAQLGGTAGGLAWSERLAASEITRHGNELAHGQFDSMRGRTANWEYTTGLLTQAIYQAGKANGNAAQTDWAKGIIDSYVTADGQLRTYDQGQYNIDSINSGRMLLRLYRDTGAAKYRKAAEHLREQLHQHPRLDAGAFWHKQKYPYQLWLDGVYMGMPFLAEYSVLFEEGASLDEVVQEFRVVREHLRDSKTGLYYHAWDEKKQQAWADPGTGLSHHFWGRGVGWLAMAVVDTLEFIPEQRPDLRAELTAMARVLADALLSVQRSDGTWDQILDQPGKPGNYPESSASAMFTYLLAKGVRDGVLPANYGPAAERAYRALVDNFIRVDADGSVHITQACEVGGLGFGRDGSYDYYMSEPIVDNDPKALGPMIMLGALFDDQWSAREQD